VDTQNQFQLCNITYL